ncbi:MAG: heme exporter protein CcmD [Actinobacteria bacterium]|nr:heme exporter protein CcmD [Actinomycetota bacterium]
MALAPPGRIRCRPERQGADGRSHAVHPVPRALRLHGAFRVDGAAPPACHPPGGHRCRPRAGRRHRGPPRRGGEVKHATFIIGSWVLTFASVAGYSVWVVRRGRQLAKSATKEEMPWT